MGRSFRGADDGGRQNIVFGVLTIVASVTVVGGIALYKHYAMKAGSIAEGSACEHAFDIAHAFEFSKFRQMATPGGNDPDKAGINDPAVQEAVGEQQGERDHFAAVLGGLAAANAAVAARGQAPLFCAPGNWAAPRAGAFDAYWAAFEGRRRLDAGVCRRDYAEDILAWVRAAYRCNG